MRVRLNEKKYIQEAFNCPQWKGQQKTLGNRPRRDQKAPGPGPHQIPHQDSGAVRRRAVQQGDPGLPSDSRRQAHRWQRRKKKQTLRSQRGRTDNARSTCTDGEYRSIIGSLTWLMNGTRPDLAIQFDAQQSSAQDVHLPVGYADSDFAGDLDDRKSTSGYVFTLGNGAISWRARKQPLVAFSTVEAEYIDASDARRRPYGSPPYTLAY